MSLIVPLLSLALIAATSILGARRVVLATMLLRPSCDQIFNWLKEMTGQQTGPGASLNILMIALGAAALIIFPGLLATPAILAFGAFLAAALASLFHGPDPAGGVRLLLTLATYMAMLTLPYSLVRSQADAIKYLNIAALSSLAPTVYSLIGLAFIPGFLGEEQRLQSTFTHPNIYAFYLVGVVTVLLFLQSSKAAAQSRNARVWLTAYICLLLVLLLLTKTRSAWVAMSLILGANAIAINPRWFALVLALPLALLFPGVSERIADLDSGNIAAGYDQLNSYAWRQLLWSDTLQWMADNPASIFGNGLDLFKTYVPAFFAQGADQPGVGPHNAFLQIYFEMGIAGLAAFAALFVALFYELGSRLKHDFAGSLMMIMLCVGYLTVSYSDNVLDYLQFQWFFWFCVGTVCASRRFSGAAARWAYGAERRSAIARLTRRQSVS